MQMEHSAGLAQNAVTGDVEARGWLGVGQNMGDREPRGEGGDYDDYRNEAKSAREQGFSVIPA
jgi:hypothetical protein